MLPHVQKLSTSFILRYKKNRLQIIIPSCKLKIYKIHDISTQFQGRYQAKLIEYSQACMLRSL